MADDDDGCLLLFPAVLGILSLVFGLATLWCQLVVLPATPSFSGAVPEPMYGLISQRQLQFEGVAWDANNPTVPTLVYSTACVSYPEGTVRDSKWNAAYILSITSYCLGGLLSCLLFAAQCGCIQLSNKAVLVYGFFFLITCAFQGLAFLMLQSTLCTDNPFTDVGQVGYYQDLGVYETSCVMGSAGIMAILSIIGWFFCAVCCFCAARSSGDGDGDEDAAAAYAPDEEKEPKEAEQDAPQAETDEDAAGDADA